VFEDFLLYSWAQSLDCVTQLFGDATITGLAHLLRIYRCLFGFFSRENLVSPALPVQLKWAPTPLELNVFLWVTSFVIALLFFMLACFCFARSLHRPIGLLFPQLGKNHPQQKTAALKVFLKNGLKSSDCSTMCHLG